MSFVSCIVMMSGWYDNVFVDCEWVGGGLFVMGSCVVCAWCYILCVYEWCISSQVCIVQLIICIIALSNFNPTSTSKGLVSLTCHVTADTTGIHSTF